MRLYREKSKLLNLCAILVDVRLLTSNRNALSCWSPSVIFYSWWNLLKCACIEESGKESLVFEYVLLWCYFSYAMPEILWLCTFRYNGWLYSPYSHAGDYKGYLTAITSIVWLTTIQLTIYRYVERCANFSYVLPQTMQRGEGRWWMMHWPHHWSCAFRLCEWEVLCCVLFIVSMFLLQVEEYFCELEQILNNSLIFDWDSHPNHNYNDYLIICNYKIICSIFSITLHVLPPTSYKCKTWLYYLFIFRIFIMENPNQWMADRWRSLIRRDWKLLHTV